MPPPSELYTLAATKAKEIEAELKRLNRWSGHHPPSEAFENMGAFGSNTMPFEQWIQFVLIPSIRAIVEEHGDFPASSHLATYAIRIFDGDSEAGRLHDLLYDLDTIINKKDSPPDESMIADHVEDIPKVSLGDIEIPSVVFSLIEVLPQFEGEDLESQLQTYDTFLSILSPSVRPRIANLLKEAAMKTSNENSKVRILEAARTVENGGRAAAPYDHDKAMKRYREEHKKNFS